MLAIIARIELNPAHVPAYLEAANKGVDITRAEKGCELYAFARDSRDEGVIWISEQWASQQDLDNHLRTDHVKALIADIAGLEMHSMDARQFEVSSVGPVIMPQD